MIPDSSPLMGPCSQCGSSDALATYPDHSWCFSCETFNFVGNEMQTEPKVIPMKSRIKRTFKIADIPVKAEKDTNTFSSMNDVLEHMWNLQQDNAKEAIKVQTDDSSRTEAIHKIRDGLQKISEGLGKLL